MGLTLVARLTPVILAIATLVGGCTVANSNESVCEPAPGLVAVVSVHQNVQAPSVNRALGCTLEATIAAGEPIVVIGVDGTPETLLAQTFEVTDANPDARRDDIAAATAAVVNLINTAEADSDGSNLLMGIGMGADQARALGASHAHLVIIDSGLSDLGLNMTQPGMLAAQPAEVADFLAASGSTLDLQGFSGELVGFGYVSAPQDQLPIAAQKNTVAIWTGVLESFGMTVTVTPLARTGAGPDTAYTTQTVDVPAPPMLAIDEPRDEVAEPPDMVYDSTSVLGFHDDSNELLDRIAAAAELAPVAKWLAADTGRSVHIVGTTASYGTKEGQVTRSLGRAETIKSMLVAAGADPTQITTEGAGYTANPPDRTATGAHDPAAAALNRTVHLIPRANP